MLGAGIQPDVIAYTTAIKVKSSSYASLVVVKWMCQWALAQMAFILLTIMNEGRGCGFKTHWVGVCNLKLYFSWTLNKKFCFFGALSQIYWT